jgi:hypothetical protein
MSLSWVPLARELGFCFWCSFLLGLVVAFFLKKIGDLLIIINNSASILENKEKNTNKYLNHLATTIGGAS